MVALKRFFALTVLAILSAFATADDLIVQLAPGATAQAVATSYGITLVDTTANAPFAFYFVNPAATDGIENAMKTDPRIVWFDLDEDVSSPEVPVESKGTVIPAVADRSALYNLNAGLLSQIHWTPGLVLANPVKPVCVAVLDTGLSSYATNIWARTKARANFIDNSPGAYDFPKFFSSSRLYDPHANDGLGHGSMVVGLIDQIAPNVNFVIARVADSAGNATAWSIVKGLAFAVNNGAQLCNVSLGTTVESVALEGAATWASQQGLIIVAPSGNLGLGTALNPASFPDVVCVTGVLPNDVKAPFSDWDENAVSAAPATGVKSIYWNGKVAIWSGTSFSAPLVTGALALALSRGMVLDSTTARAFMHQNGDPIDALNPLYSELLGTRLNCTTVAAAASPGP